MTDRFHKLGPPLIKRCVTEPMFAPDFLDQDAGLRLPQKTNNSLYADSLVRIPIILWVSGLFGKITGTV